MERKEEKMNTQKLNEAIADHLNEPYGWYCFHCAEYVPSETVTYDETHQTCGYDVQNREPNYTDSLNTIHEAVKGLTDYQWLEYSRALKEQFGFDWNYRQLIEATALQRSIAYAKAKNLQIE